MSGVFLLAMILILVNDTNVIYEYFKPILPFVKEYDDKLGLTYIEYLETMYNNYFTRMINCPYCLGFWLSIIISHSLSFPMVYCLGLLLYFSIKKLSK